MSRNIALDILKLSLAFMVVGLHAGFLNDISSLASYLTVNGLFRIAVPIFLLINGFFFLPVLERSGATAWLKKILILYIVWMSFYSYFWVISPLGSENYIAQLIRSILFGYHHLWYLSGMIGAAIVLIALQGWTTQHLLNSVLVTSFLGVVIQYCSSYHVFAGTPLEVLFSHYELHRNFLFFSYPFFCMGYLINRHAFHKTIETHWLVTLGATGLVFLSMESYLDFYFEIGRSDYDNFMSLLLLCPVIFMCFMRLTIEGQSKNIALYSSAVYFIHSFFLSVFRKFTDFEGTMLTLVIIAASLLASFFIIRLNSKLKFIL